MADGESLRDVGEHAFLARLCHRLRIRASHEPSKETLRSTDTIVVGPGDDAAVLRLGEGDLAITTDAQVEGVHFRAGWLAPRELGWRSIAVALSDLAAMGARPTATLVSLTAPAEAPVAMLDELLDACASASEECGAALIGGNLSRGGALSITVTAFGQIADRCLRRAGARPGDRLVVTGTLGDAAAAVASWQAGRAPSPLLRERYAHPEARIAAGIALAAAGAHAAIDVSDGLVADLGHLCAASHVGADVWRSRLPRSADVAALDAAGGDFAAAGGEDYEILAACSPDLTDADLRRISDETGVALTVIGSCTVSDQIRLLDEDERPHRVKAGGFDHFSSAPDGTV